MVIEAEGPACTCGSHGCLESLAGGWALEKWYSERTGEKLTGAQIHERARSGDKEAIFLYQRLGYYLGIACASLVNILNPDIIVLGVASAQPSPYGKTYMRQRSADAQCTRKRHANRG